MKIVVADRDGHEIRQLDGTGHAGINRVNWDLRYPMPIEPSAEDRWASSEGYFAGGIHDLGPFVEPGEYRVTVKAGAREAAKTVRVEDDPSIVISPQDRTRRRDAMMKAYDLYRASAAEVETVRSLRTSLNAVLDSWKGDHAPAVPDGVRQQAEAFSKTVDELVLLFVGRQGADPTSVGLTYVPPPVPNRLATVLHNFQSYTAAPRQADLDKLAELTPVARDAGERLKQAITVDLAKLNKAMNDAGIPHIAVRTSQSQS